MCFLIEQGGKEDKLLMPDIDERHICSEKTLKTAFFDDDCGLFFAEWVTVSSSLTRCDSHSEIIIT